MRSLPRLLLPLALVLSLSASAEPPKFATVDAARVFDRYYKTEETKQKIAEERAALKKDRRLEVIKLTRVELLDLRDNVRNPSFADEERDEYFRKFQMKAHELRALQRDTLQFIEEESKKIDAKMVQQTKDLLAVIQTEIQKVAKKDGYDFVFENSGKTSSQIPTLIYIRGATDITDDVIESLNKDAPKDKKVAGTGS